VPASTALNDDDNHIPSCNNNTKRYSHNQQPPHSNTTRNDRAHPGLAPDVAADDNDGNSPQPLLAQQSTPMIIPTPLTTPMPLPDIQVLDCSNSTLQHTTTTQSELHLDWLLLPMMMTMTNNPSQPSQPPDSPVLPSYSKPKEFLHPPHNHCFSHPSALS